MNNKIIEISLKELGKKIHVWQDKLKDDQLTLGNRQREQFVGILQERYGYSPEKAQSELNKHYTKIILK